MNSAIVLIVLLSVFSMIMAILAAKKPKESALEQKDIKNTSLADSNKTEAVSSLKEEPTVITQEDKIFNSLNEIHKKLDALEDNVLIIRDLK